MEKLHDWGFPVALLLGWMVAAAYAVSLLIGPMDRQVPAPQPPAPEPAAVADLRF